MLRRRWWFAVIGLPVISLMAGLAPAGAGSTQPGCATFVQTGKQVCGRFLQYWNEHGELAQQGYPISEEFRETSDTDGKTYTVQYFERAVFEYHPENRAPNDVLLQLLGVFLYKQKYPSGAPQQSPIRSDTSTSYGGGIKSTHFERFPQTGHFISGVFLDYWQQHGGLAQQGYPISDQFQEKSDLDGKIYTVQYFERAVFEYHPENRAPFNVLLSQLGTFRMKQKYPAGQPASTPGPGGGDVWATLANRPLNIPSLPSSGKCPANSGAIVSSDYGPALGSGPVYPVGFGAEGKIDLATTVKDQGGYYVKVLWVSKPGLNDSVLVRGAQLPGSGSAILHFGKGTSPSDQLRLDTASTAASASGWHEWPTYTRIAGSGCYAYQVDSSSFSYVVTFWAIMTMP